MLFLFQFKTFIFGNGFLFSKHQTHIFRFLLLGLFSTFVLLLVFHTFNLMLNIEFIFAWTLERLNLMHSFHGLYLSINIRWMQLKKTNCKKCLLFFCYLCKLELVKQTLHFILFCGSFFCYFCRCLFSTLHCYIYNIEHWRIEFQPHKQ